MTEHPNLFWGQAFGARPEYTFPPTALPVWIIASFALLLLRGGGWLAKSHLLVMFRSDDVLVLRWAAASRACVLLLAMLICTLTEPFDASLSLATASPLAPLASWDGVHFVGIALSGYTSDHSHAFFPLLPMLMRALRCEGGGVSASV